MKYKKNLTKKEINQFISDKTGISETIIGKFNDELIFYLTQILVTKKNIKIKNFGSFNCRNKSSRIGRNPKTKEQYKIKERVVVNFSPSKNLIMKLNSD